MAVLLPEGINPAIHIASFGFGFKGWNRLVPALHLLFSPGLFIMSAEIKYTEIPRKCSDLRRVFFIHQNPAIMRVANTFHRDHLPLHQLDRFRTRHGKADDRNAPYDFSSPYAFHIDWFGASHPPQKKCVHRWQDGTLIEECQRYQGIEQTITDVRWLQPPEPEKAIHGYPQDDQKLMLSFLPEIHYL